MTPTSLFGLPEQAPPERVLLATDPATGAPAPGAADGADTAADATPADKAPADDGARTSEAPDRD